MTATSGMNIAQRILHVGGRSNAAGYVEFGSIQAVEALVRQVLRDLPAPQSQQSEGSVCARCGGFVFDPVLVQPAVGGTLQELHTKLLGDVTHHSV